MEKFELCFNIVGTFDYIIPELLQAERTDIDATAYRSSSNLQLHYAYGFMPAGILTRLICRLHYLVRGDHYWKNGVELEFYGSFALVQSDPVQKRIRISVSGASPVQLMAIIRSHFDHIHDTLNMKKDEHVLEEVPCNCSECTRSDKPVFHEFKTLQKYLDKGKTTITCKRSVEDVSVHQLLQGLMPPEKTEKLFDTFITVVSQVHGISKTLKSDENSRNTVVALLLGTRGFRVKDQTLWARSASGKRMAELDIKIEDETGRTVSIIEALILEGFNSTVIESHVGKVLEKYNCTGLKEMYILVYAGEKDFTGLCGKYMQHLGKISYGENTLLGGIETVESGLNAIRVYRAKHKCNDGETELNHVLVRM